MYLTLQTVHLSFCQVIPVDELVTGSFKANFGFLKWFKTFFKENSKDMDYDPVQSRGGEEICLVHILMNSPKRGRPAVPKYPHILIYILEFITSQRKLQ